eukprot:3938880-Rhodomonas_salina.2
MGLLLSGRGGGLPPSREAPTSSARVRACCSLGLTRRRCCQVLLPPLCGVALEGEARYECVSLSKEKGGEKQPVWVKIWPVRHVICAIHLPHLLAIRLLSCAICTIQWLCVRDPTAVWPAGEVECVGLTHNNQGCNSRWESGLCPQARLNVNSKGKTIEEHEVTCCVFCNL